jgi:hypothetical protein
MTSPTRTPADGPSVDLTGAATVGVPIADPRAEDEVVVAAFERYEAAQEAVDLLSDKGFPIASARVVGTGLRLSEQVLGRVTNQTAAKAGAYSGAGFGLLIGLILGVATSGAAWGIGVIACVAAGAGWGALTGYAAHRATGGRRDFASVRTLEAERYELLVASEYAVRARWMLSQGR